MCGRFGDEHFSHGDRRAHEMQPPPHLSSLSSRSCCFPRRSPVLRCHFCFKNVFSDKWPDEIYPDLAPDYLPPKF